MLPSKLTWQLNPLTFIKTFFESHSKLQRAELEISSTCKVFNPFLDNYFQGVSNICGDINPFQRFSGVFRGYKMGIWARNGLNIGISFSEIQNQIHIMRKFWTNLLFFLNHFFHNVLFWSPWKHQKTEGFLMFSRGTKGNIGKKRIKNQSNNNKR